ncbi:MAG: zinc-ribbon domain-containing protein [Betaproteobacteria bacterium]|nr:zinc-ribbon domain-containing protein [Betaproteobacteria bacterium]
MATGMATRCSACGTVFRVVPDQLRVSEGWVRCGRCAEVFNASEVLIDLETGAPLAGRDEPPPRAMAQFTSRRPTAPTAPTPPPTPRKDAELATPADFDRQDEPPPAPGMPVVDETESRFADDAAEDFAPRAASAATEAAPAHADIGADARSQPTPMFLRQAERTARWRQPRVRAALWGTAVLATVALATQVVMEYRDLAAARFPSARPALEQACAWLGCTVGAAHVIEGLVVESSGLVRVEKSDVYKLSVALRNRAALEVALPALELSLTDSQGQLVARRVLPMSDLGVNQASLAAGRELSLNATLQAATAPIAGYTIELFYP